MSLENKHHCIHLQRAFNKYGEDNFKIEVIFECEEIENKEQELLDSLCFQIYITHQKEVVGI
jgi:hypothetical protein